MANKPRSFKNLGYGGGSLSWNAERGKVELRHRIDGKAYRERGDTTAECLRLRDERRAKVQRKSSAIVTTDDAILARLDRLAEQLAVLRDRQETLINAIASLRLVNLGGM